MPDTRCSEQDDGDLVCLRAAALGGARCTPPPPHPPLEQQAVGSGAAFWRAESGARVPEGRRGSRWRCVVDCLSTEHVRNA
jgi:hypothetical protein